MSDDAQLAVRAGSSSRKTSWYSRQGWMKPAHVTVPGQVCKYRCCACSKEMHQTEVPRHIWLQHLQQRLHSPLCQDCSQLLRSLHDSESARDSAGIKKWMGKLAEHVSTQHDELRFAPPASPPTAEPLSVLSPEQNSVSSPSFLAVQTFAPDARYPNDESKQHETPTAWPIVLLRQRRVLLPPSPASDSWFAERSGLLRR